MVKVDVIKNRVIEEKDLENSEAELKGQPEEGALKKDEEKGEIPPEEMTGSELLDKIKEVQALADKNFDLYVRSQAEIDNLKKRFRKEKGDLAKFSNESLIKQLLPVLDSLENAILHSQDENALHALREGVDLTLKGLKNTLEREGVEEINAVGEPFDPNFHQAMSEQEDDSVKPGMVLKELQKGYMLNQRLIRPAMVIVSKGLAQ